MAMDILEREEISNKSEIEKLLEEIKSSVIGFENYKQFFDKIKNSDQIIMSQIENLVREYREYKVKFTKEFEKDSHKQLMDDGFVKLDVFDNSRMMNKIILEAYNWKTLQEELYNIIFQKIYRVLDDARALDIKRDALAEMKEMEEKRQAMFIEIMNNNANMFRDTVFTKLQNFDEKFLQLVLMMDEDNRKDRKELFDTLKKIIQDVNVIEVQKREKIIKEIQQDDYESKRDRLYKREEEERKQREQQQRQQMLQQQQRPQPQRQPLEQPKIKPNVKMDDIDTQFNDMDMDDGGEVDDEIYNDGDSYERFN